LAAFYGPKVQFYKKLFMQSFGGPMAWFGEAFLRFCCRILRWKKENQFESKPRIVCFSRNP
jgi:hypothetical protein